MTIPLEEYRELDARLRQGRKNGSLTGDAEDELMDQMDDLWWKMSPEERDKFETTPATGMAYIAAERARQIQEEGWAHEHDDQHTKEEMAWAAACYAKPPLYRSVAMNDGRAAPSTWPWDPEWWKPTPDDRIRELAKAGALIAAEIDRLLRLKER